jgi:hypothetical protein
MRRSDDRGVARGESVVFLESGGSYKVEPDGISDTALWNAGDDVLVCGDKKMINQGGRILLESRG